jgi:hypothetical protein
LFTLGFEWFVRHPETIHVSEKSPMVRLAGNDSASSIWRGE